MREAEVDLEVSKRLNMRSLFVVAAGFLAFLALLTAGTLKLYDFLTNPNRIFPGDPLLQQAVRDLESANAILASTPDDESAHLLRAKAFFLLGNLEGAKVECENRHSDADGDWKELEEKLQELEEKMSKVRQLVQEAEMSPSPADKYPPIHALLDEIAERFQGIPRYRALFLKSYLLLREGRRGEAQPLLAGPLASYTPLREYVMYYHARSLMVQGSEEKALEAFRKFIELNPSSRLAPLALLERVNLLRDLGRMDEAIGECRRLTEKYPESEFAPKALRKWAEIYESAMDLENALPIRIRLLKEYPDSQEARDTLEMFFGGLYSFDFLGEDDLLTVAYAAARFHPAEALESLSALVESSTLSEEKRAQASLGAAVCESAQRKYQEAIEWCKKAIALAPETEWAERAGIRIGNAYMNLKEPEKALEAYWDVVQNGGPLASEAAERFWKLAYELGDMVKVEDACRKVANEHPRSSQAPGAMALLAYLGCLNGEYQTARSYAQRCVGAFSNHPASAEARFWLAKALEKLGQRAEARQEYQKLARDVPWSFWGIKAAEIAGFSEENPVSIDPLDFNVVKASVYDGNLAIAWELYDVGILELAESEFKFAMGKGERGAQCGLALVQAESGRFRAGVVTLREAALKGEQAFLTPGRKERILNVLYPRPFRDEVVSAALAHNVLPSWLWGTMHQESTFDPNARSSAGAIGLMQIMPDTGRFIASQRGARSFDPNRLWDPKLNIDYGAWYLDYLRNQVGDNLLFVAASYNGGVGQFRRLRASVSLEDDVMFVRSIPREETRNFAIWVYSNVKIYDSILKSENFELVPF